MIAKSIQTVWHVSSPQLTRQVEEVVRTVPIQMRSDLDQPYPAATSIIHYAHPYRTGKTYMFR